MKLTYYLSTAPMIAYVTDPRMPLVVDCSPVVGIGRDGLLVIHPAHEAMLLFWLALLGITMRRHNG